MASMQERVLALIEKKEEYRRNKDASLASLQKQIDEVHNNPSAGLDKLASWRDYKKYLLEEKKQLHIELQQQYALLSPGMASDAGVL